MNIKTAINSIKTNVLYLSNWFKNNKNYNVLAIAFIIGFITFSSWSAFVLGCMLWFGYWFLTKKTNSESFLSFFNIDFKKYIINAIVGLFAASLILLIC